MPYGAAWRWKDGEANSKFDATRLNSMAGQGNVYQQDGQLLKVDIGAAFLRNVSAGAADIQYAGSTGNAVAASNTNYVYLSSAGAVVINTTGFPAYPGTKFFPLAEVVCDGTQITSIVDRRCLVC